MIYVALRMLLGDTTKWIGVVLGVFLCTFLITHMLSMFSGMMERSYSMISDIPEARIWVMDPAVEYVDEPIGMPDGALQRVRGVDGVKWAMPLMTTTLATRLPNGYFRGVLLVGVDDATLIGAPRNIVKGSVNDLRSADAIIVDARSAKDRLRIPIDAAAARNQAERGPLADLATRPLAVGDDLAMNDHRARVVGLADLGLRFINKPVAYTTYSNALRFAPAQRHMLSFVLVAGEPGLDNNELARRITQQTGLLARTDKQFIDATYNYFIKVTGVVERIAFLVGIGLVIGVSISALLLYLFTAENARYYATFLALGASRGTLMLMIIVQALVSSATGYGLGIGGSNLLGQLLARDAMPYKLVNGTLLFAACAVIIVAVVASMLSARRVMTLEPGIVFKT